MAQTKAQRLALIKKAAKSFNEKMARERRIMADCEPRDENWNHWTDASSYANEYYGDTMRATTRFDNDWD
tara:strand:+ start:179 stop:388 length:210 start_codon:yes stop_codon:yes gene_type:complete